MDEKEIIIQKITDVLRSQDIYSPMLDSLINVFAEVEILKSKAYVTAKRKPITVKEKSREGEVREKKHPAHTAYSDYVEIYLKILDRLGMTVKANVSSENDPLADVYNEVNSVEE